VVSCLLRGEPMSRYYIFYDSSKKAVRTSTRKPSSYPYVHLTEKNLVIHFSEKVKVSTSDMQEAQYFLMAHELNSEGERREAFRALRKRLEVYRV